MNKARRNLKQYTHEGYTFTYAALVIAGLDATFAVVQSVNMEEPLADFCGYCDLVPDGSHDGDVLHPAAIVTFEYSRDGDPDAREMVSKDYIPVSLEAATEALVTGQPLWSEVPAPRLPGVPPEMEKVADEYFRDALHQLTGEKPPKKFRFKPESPLIDEQQDWCCMNVKPSWACGVSLLEAAEAFVVDAASNGNILSPNAGYPAPFETKAREVKRKKRFATTHT